MSSFLQAGWKHVVEFLSPDEIEGILHACNALLAAAEDQQFPLDKPHAGTRHLVDLDQRIGLVQQVLNRPTLTNTVAAFVGRPFERLQVSYRSPQPGFGSQKLHTDAVPKLASGPDLVATAIVPLVDFRDDNGSTRLVPGSHLRPDLQRIAGNLDTHSQEIRLEGAAGCAFVFSGHILHSGTRNQSHAERPALQLQWERAR